MTWFITLKRLLALLTILMLPRFCLGDPSPHYNLAYTTTQPQGNPLYLAALEEDRSPSLDINNSTATPTADQLEFPHLNLPSTPDWDGLMHDSKLLIFYQFGVVGVLYFMPQSISKWSEGQKRGNPLRRWDENVNDFRMDTDMWAVNYIGHPYFGGVYYVRARERGFDRQGSFWFAVTLSTMFEFGTEAFFEQPSVQDMIFTPVGGAIVGEYFMTARENIKRDIAEKGYATTRDHLELFLTDPLGVLNDKVDKFWGDKEAHLNLLPLFSRTGADQHSLPSLIGVQTHLSW